MSTISAKPSEVEHKWYLVDAAGKTLGRLAANIAARLRGKHKPIYTPHVDTGDYIVVINAEKVTVTGKKHKDKIYHRHSGYMGGLKSVPFEKMQAEDPEHIIETAVQGMLPKGPLGRQMYRKLKVYAGTSHPHQSQNPEPLQEI